MESFIAIALSLFCSLLYDFVKGLFFKLDEYLRSKKTSQVIIL
ncbi:hypothetical protein M2408_000762 [Sphingobacterium sp. BIGb0165]|nr:hypothetical protein [Sphingobacterium sp. BIGb0165]